MAGTVLAGQPLAIEYNQAVLQDKPENSEEAEEQFTERYQNSNSEKAPMQQDASKGTGGAGIQQDGFFITEDLNQQDGE